ncbi:hypothetical protein A9Q96_06295 [Rhodobacterales bacterium 52_120_T64]|nr:hypothetical protein A9Q96_06295 [Rhodobacterales bacterium 52_120_T64]
MGQIYHICAAQAVGVGVDYEVIDRLKATVGDAKYEEITERSAFQLADLLGRLERALREVDMTMCYRLALNICGVASQIGLVDVAGVASDVMTCTTKGNMEALSAVTGRLNRVAEASLFSVFELEV